jgi:hypothetical protein
MASLTWSQILDAAERIEKNSFNGFVRVTFSNAFAREQRFLAHQKSTSKRFSVLQVFKLFSKIALSLERFLNLSAITNSKRNNAIL